MNVTDQPLRILLIEDDEDDMILLQDLLDDMDDLETVLHWEATYEGGREALRTGDHDLCFMDYRLGVRDGIALIQELDHSNPSTPIIFLTGQESRELDMQAMEAGAADYLVKAKIDPSLLERSIRYALERHRLLLEMHRRSLVDQLTGVLNRRGLEEQMAREMKLARRRDKTMVVLFADVDNFKAINDLYGHTEGDRALQEVAALLVGSFRATDLVARIGGDEFVVVALDTSIQDISVPEARLQKALDRRNDAGPRYPLGLTLGLSLYDPDRPFSLWELVEQADHHMYSRKADSDSRPQARPVHRNGVHKDASNSIDRRRAGPETDGATSRTPAGGT